MAGFAIASLAKNSIMALYAGNPRFGVRLKIELMLGRCGEWHKNK